jgi:hypothetical protein
VIVGPVRTGRGRKKVKKALCWFALGALLVTGCTTEFVPGESSATQAAIGPATITTDKTSYNFGDYITVSFDGLNGNAQDWIAIAPMGSPLTTVSKWKYTGGATSGSLAFGWPQPGGMYVARAFDNNMYTLMGESDPFAVADLGDTSATVTVDQPSYAIDQDIVITWSGLPPTDLDWVSVKPVGAGNGIDSRWRYTGGTASGTLTFARGLALSSDTWTGGYYFVRLYVNDTYSHVAETAPFLIGSLVSTDADSYIAGQPIRVDWTHLPGNPGDWVAFAPAGSPNSTVTKWMFTGGAVDGSVTFATGLPSAGTYVARTFAPNTNWRSGESAPFTVSPGPVVTVTTDMSTYSTYQDIVVTWSNLLSNPNDWISLAPSGSSDQTVTRYIYTGGASSGTHTFSSGLSQAGTYVARAYQNNTYTKLGESATFDVVAPTVTVSTDMASYTAGQAITVSWSNLPGNANDWIAIAPMGSPNSTVTRWVYTGGVSTGMHTFATGVSTTGTYEARAFLNDGYTRLGTSAAFTVN